MISRVDSVKGSNVNGDIDNHNSEIELTLCDSYNALITILTLIINHVIITMFKVPGQLKNSISVEDIYRLDQILIISRKIAILC